MVAGHVASMREMRKIYKILVWIPEGSRSLGRRRLRWDDNIKMDIVSKGE
jgi:hypothetical protein